MTTSKSPDRTSRLVLGLVTALAVLWTAGAVLAPWLATHGGMLGGWLKLVYRPGCHQLIDRCLDLGFGPLAVCARCIGLYIGGCLGLLWMSLRNRPARLRPRWLAIVAAPTLIDFAAGQIGLPSLGNWSRMILAIPLGCVPALFIADALIEIVRLNTASKPADDRRFR